MGYVTANFTIRQQLCLKLSKNDKMKRLHLAVFYNVLLKHGCYNQFVR